jgi:hypothetical protein
VETTADDNNEMIDVLIDIIKRKLKEAKDNEDILRLTDLRNKLLDMKGKEIEEETNIKKEADNMLNTFI